MSCLDAHATHELLFLTTELILSVFRSHLHLILVDYHLSDSIMTFACHGYLGDLMFINLAPLDDVGKAITHVVELEVSASLWAGVFTVRVIVEIDALVVHQASFVINI